MEWGPSVRACVRPGWYLTNHLTLYETLPIYLFVNSVPCVQPIFGKLEFKIPNFTPEQFLWTCAFIRKVIWVREALPKFSIFSKSVPYIRAMCSPKFRTILIQNGRLRDIFTSKWCKFCPSGLISHKPFNLLFWHITHLLLPLCHAFSQVSEN